jgi:hypothetical protein
VSIEVYCLDYLLKIDEVAVLKEVNLGVDECFPRKLSSFVFDVVLALENRLKSCEVLE